MLLYSEDGVVQIGQPVLEGIQVNASLLEDLRGDKIRVSQFKAKARHRRVHGHRQYLSRVKIETIGTTGKKEKVTKVEKVDPGEKVTVG